MIAQRDRNGTWHVTDPEEAACDWSPPDEGADAIETGTLAMIASTIDGGTCDDCDWGTGPAAAPLDAGETVSPDG